MADGPLGATGSPGLLAFAPLVLVGCGNVRPGESSGAGRRVGGWLLIGLQVSKGPGSCFATGCGRGGGEV